MDIVVWISPLQTKNTKGNNCNSSLTPHVHHWGVFPIHKDLSGSWFACNLHTSMSFIICFVSMFVELGALGGWGDNICNVKRTLMFCSTGKTHPFYKSKLMINGFKGCFILWEERFCILLLRSNGRLKSSVHSMWFISFHRCTTHFCVSICLICCTNFCTSVLTTPTPNGWPITT